MSTINDGHNELEAPEEAGEVVHPPPGWQVRPPSFFQQLMLIKRNDNNDHTQHRTTTTTTRPTHNTRTFDVRTRARRCQRQLGPNGQAIPVTTTMICGCHIIVNAQATSVDVSSAFTTSFRQHVSHCWVCIAATPCSAAAE